MRILQKVAAIALAVAIVAVAAVAARMVDDAEAPQGYYLR